MTQMNLSRQQRLTDIENRLVAAKGGMDREFGISKYKLSYIEWISNKVLFLAQRTISNIL